MNPTWIDMVYFGMLLTLDAPLSPPTPHLLSTRPETPQVTFALRWGGGEVILRIFLILKPQCARRPNPRWAMVFLLFWSRITVSLFYPHLCPPPPSPFSDNPKFSPPPLRTVQYVRVLICHCLSACLPLFCCLLSCCVSVLFCLVSRLLSLAFLSCLVSKSALLFNSSFYTSTSALPLLLPLLTFFASHQTFWLMI